MTILKNMTPHPLAIRATRGDILNIPPEPTPARLTTAKSPRPPLAGVVDVPVEIGVSEVQFGATENLPAPAEGVAYIVSGLVLAQHPDRADLFASGELIREAAYAPSELADVQAALELCGVDPALAARVLGALKGAQGRVIAADGLSCTPAYGKPAPAPEPTRPTAPDPAPTRGEILDAMRAHPPADVLVDTHGHFVRGGWQALRDWAAQHLPTAKHVGWDFLDVLYAVQTERAASAPDNYREEVARATSTNGRYGVILVAHPRHRGAASVIGQMEGIAMIPDHRAVVAGQANGFDVVRIEPDATCNVVIGGDLRHHGGTPALLSVGLQSNACASVLNVHAGEIVTHVGYKGRQRDSYRVAGEHLEPVSPAELV